jgi:hypothetical protein
MQFLNKTWKTSTRPLVATGKRIKNFFRQKSIESTESPAADVLSDMENAIKGNAKSRVFHLPACEYYNCKNCTLIFKDIDIALESGFEPCQFCKDLIKDHRQQIASKSPPVQKQ